MNLSPGSPRSPRELRQLRRSIAAITAQNGLTLTEIHGIEIVAHEAVCMAAQQRKLQNCPPPDTIPVQPSVSAERQTARGHRLLSFLHRRHREVPLQGGHIEDKSSAGSIRAMQVTGLLRRAGRRVSSAVFSVRQLVHR